MGVNSRATQELLNIMSDNEWHNTTYLGIAAGAYVRPEIAYRTSAYGKHYGHSRKPNLALGRHMWVRAKLVYWRKIGKVERRQIGKIAEWKLITEEAVDTE